MLKITIEGDLSGMRGIFAALLEATTTVTDTPISLPAQDIVLPIIPDAADTSVEPPVEPVAGHETIRDRVLDTLRQYQGFTDEQLAAQMDIEVSKVKTATKALFRQGKIERDLTSRGQEIRPFHWSITTTAEPATDITRKPVFIPVILDYIGKNPNKTSAEIAKATKIEYSRVTSGVCNLIAGKRIQKTGRGGFNDPYRYSIAEDSVPQTGAG